jgi:hypothetical protein
MGAMPALVVGISCFPVFPYMPTTSVGMAPDFPQQKLMNCANWPRLPGGLAFGILGKAE